MQVVIPGQSNRVKADLTIHDTGQPMTSGIVTFYLYALSGANELKWFRASDNTWQSAESSAGTGTHVADGHWICSIGSAAWSYGVVYMLYAKRSDDEHIAYSEQVVPSCTVGIVGSGSVAWPYVLTDSVTGNPIADATVWATTDSAGVNVVARGTTNDFGTVTFYLYPGTYYIWRRKTGYRFGTTPDTEPDVEIVTA